MKFDYGKLTRQYVKWVERETGGNPVYEPAEIGEIIKTLKEPLTEGKCRGLGQELSYLANWNARRGVVLISEGDARGWFNLLRSAQYSFWNIRIRSRSYDRAENKLKALDFTASIIDAGQCGIACMALGAWTETEWMAHRLQQSRTDGSITPWTWYHAVPRLVIALQRFVEVRKDVGDLELAVYKDIFVHWNNRINLQQALLSAADYHVENLRDKSNAGIAEFTHPPVDIFPAELIAVQRVREKLGLKTPAIDHPLMNTPFASPPKDLRPEPDELLAEVLYNVRTIIPDL
jgi:hypothetical protein